MTQKIILFFLLISFQIHADIIYVNQNVVGGANDGSSWENAYSEIQDALGVAANVDQIWVAAGTYRPDWNGSTYTMNTNDRFTITANNLKIYGGFSGGETSLYERNILGNPTIISGDLNGDDTITFPVFSNTSDNSLVLFDIQASAYNFLINGFTITGANGGTNSSAIHTIASNSIFSHCTVLNNQGESIFDIDLTATVRNCLVYNNYNNSLGTIHTDNYGIRIENSNIIYNHGQDIGGVFLDSVNTPANIIGGSIFWGNTAVSSTYTSEQINILSANTSPNAITYFQNNIIENFSGTQHQMTSTSNNNLDPLFVNPGSQNYNLQNTSPAIDTGDSALSNYDFDLNGNIRVDNSMPDKGCFETIQTSPIRYYVNSNVSGGANNGSSWSNAFSELNDAINTAGNNDEIWVAAGNYRPDWNGTTYTNDRFAQFFITQNHLKIYGGFNGSETNLSQRNWNANQTSLIGDLNGDDSISFPTFSNTSDNTIRLLGISGNHVILDGFEISGTDGINDFDRSIGLFGDNIQINNCKIFNNQGLSIIEEPAGRSRLENCLIYNNYNSQSGTIFTHDFGTQFINCSIVNNHGANFSGLYSGAFNFGSVVENCIFWGNTAVSTTYTTEQINCSNVSIDDDSFMLFENNIVEGFSGTQHQMTSNSNLNSNPLFTNPGINDFTLLTGSPAIDAGLNARVTQTVDLNFAARIDNGTVDMGAFEHQIALSTPDFNTNNIIIYPNPSTDFIWITNAPENLDYEIIDLNGKLILKNNILPISTEHIAEGLYLLKITDSITKNETILKFIKN